MKIYIDHFPGEDEFVKNLTNRLRAIDNNILVDTFLEYRGKGKDAGLKGSLESIENSEIIIPVITSSYLSLNDKETDEKLASISNSNNKFLLPIIYSPANWSSKTWIVKSKVFPSNGDPFTELDENDKEKVLNELLLTIENIISHNSQSPRITGKDVLEKKASNKSIVFISHDHDDADFAELLKLQLEKNNIVGWIDSERLKIGQDWRQEIDDGIANSIAVIAIMTPDARKSEYVTYEWAFAWGKGKKIFPIMLKQTPLHPRLESLQYLDFTNRVTRPWPKLIDSLLDLIK